MNRRSFLARVALVGVALAAPPVLAVARRVVPERAAAWETYIFYSDHLTKPGWNVRLINIVPKHVKWRPFA